MSGVLDNNSIGSSTHEVTEPTDSLPSILSTHIPDGANESTPEEQWINQVADSITHTITTHGGLILDAGSALPSLLGVPFSSAKVLWDINHGDMEGAKVDALMGALSATGWDVKALQLAGKGIGLAGGKAVLAKIQAFFVFKNGDRRLAAAGIDGLSPDESIIKETRGSGGGKPKNNGNGGKNTSRSGGDSSNAGGKNEGSDISTGEEGADTQANLPENKTPPGGGRRAAFRQAKRDYGIPVTENPTRVDLNYDRNGKLQPGRKYVFGSGKNSKVIREDTAGHYYADAPETSIGSHFNLGDIHPDVVKPNEEGHYIYDKFDKEKYDELKKRLWSGSR